MNETFKIIDLRTLIKKDGKKVYFAVVYSSLGYLIRIFCDENKFNELKNSDYTKIDVSKVVSKVYDSKSDTFRYYFN